MTDSAAPANVLIVDDDSSIRSACSAILTRAGFAVSEARDGEQAWERLLAVPFALVITDYVLPKASGFELVRRIREGGMSLPVILMSGQHQIEQTLGASRHLIDAILPKPFSLYELMNRVNAVLELSSRR